MKLIESECLMDGRVCLCERRLRTLVGGSSDGASRPENKTGSAMSNVGISYGDRETQGRRGTQTQKDYSGASRRASVASVIKLSAGEGKGRHEEGRKDKRIGRKCLL